MGLVFASFVSCLPTTVYSAQIAVDVRWSDVYLLGQSCQCGKQSDSHEARLLQRPLHKFTAATSNSLRSCNLWHIYATRVMFEQHCSHNFATLQPSPLDAIKRAYCYS